MKKVFILLLIIYSQFTIGQKLKSVYQKVIFTFIDCVKNNKKEKLSSQVSFPFRREYPIPQIKNKQEFLNRYNEIFDDKLVKMISNSKLTDWSDMGWRGLMLFNGEVWLDFDGKLIAINYQSKTEENLKNELVKNERNDLFPTLKKYKKPVYILETIKFRVRIDELEDGNYRFASWSISSKMSEKPDLILTNGHFIPEGSGGNHRIEFKNGKYLYGCSIIEMGEEGAPPARLEIYKDEKEILSQPAKLVK